ncbi:ABC transporter substrate-binding protein [Streptosporangium sp. NPDC004631]
MTIRRARRRSTLPLVLAGSLLLATACSGGGGDAESSAESTGTDREIFNMLPDSIKKSKVIKVGVSPNSPPLIHASGDKNVGIIPDLAAEVEKKMGVKLEIIGMDYAGLIPALQAKRIDINWSVINDTEERQETMDFVDFLRSDHGLLLHKGNPKNITDADSLCGTRAGTVKGGLDQVFLEEQKKKCAAEGKPEMEILLYNNRLGIQTAMQSGKVDSFLGIKPSHQYQAKTVKDGTVFEVADATFLPGIFGMALLKDNTRLRDAMQAALKGTVRDGEYTKILDRYDIGSSALTEDEILVNGVGNGLP